MRYLTLALIAGALLALGSCSDEQIARAQSLNDLAQVRLKQVDELVAKAEAANAVAEQLAEATHSEVALKAVADARAALAAADQARQGAKAVADAAASGVDAMKGAQASGQGTIGVLGAFAAGVVPGVLAAIPLLLKLLNTGRALAQTVRGVADARESLDPTAWNQHVGPALAKAQDADVKARVAALLKKDAA